MKISPVIALILVLGIAFAAPPIPMHPEGYLYHKAAEPKVRMDIFEDLLCGDCKNFDPPFKAFLASQYEGKDIVDLVEVYFHTYILPIHVHAFKLSQISPFLWDMHHDGKVNAAYNEWCFDHQDDFKGDVGEALSQTDVEKKICKMTDGLFGYTESDCLDMFKEQTYMMTIHNEQKFGAYYRVYTTPGVYLNGVEIDAIPETPDEWTNFMTPYLK